MLRSPASRCLMALLAFAASCLFASHALAHGDLHERIEAVTAQMLTNSTAPELWLQRADLNRQHGEFTDALADLDHVRQLKPGWAAVPLQLARIYFDAGEFARCEFAASECLKLDPANADALVLRARALVHLGKPERAVADYDAVLNVTNAAAPLPDLYLERARALATLKLWDDAIAGLDAGMKRIGFTPSLALPAIDYERQRGAFAAALTRLDQAKRFFSKESYDALRAEILNQTSKS